MNRESSLLWQQLAFGVSALALCAALLATPGPAFAQDATGETIVLDEVVLTTSSDVTEDTGLYTTEKASIAKGADSLKEVPQTVTVMTQQTLQDQNLTTMADAMAKTPGVVVTQGEGGESSFYSRGFQIKNYQIDGLGTSYDSTYTPDFDMAIYDRLEILRGAEGLFSAAGEPGGTINLVRKRPGDVVRSSASAAIGSWNNYRLEADVGGPLGLDGKLRGRLVGAWQDRDFFYQPSKEEKRVLYGVLEYDLTPSTVVSGGISYQHLKGNRWQGGLPTYTDGTQLGLPRDVALTVDWARRSEKVHEIFASVEHQFSSDWTLNVSAARQRYDFDYLRLNTNGPIDRATGSFGEPSMFSEGNGNHSNVFDVNLSGRFDAWGRDYKLIVGADSRRSYGKQIRYNVLPNTLPGDFGIDDFPGLTLPEPIVGTRNHGWPAWGAKQEGVYARLDMEVSDQLNVIVGGRYGNFDFETTYETYDENGNLSTREVTGWSDSGIFTPYAAVVYKINPDWSAYASVTEIFKPQADKLGHGNQPLDPITGRNYELGAKGTIMDGAVNLSAALYRVERKGEGVRDPGMPDDGSPCCYLAQGEIVSQGIDLEVSGEVKPGWQVFAGYSYNHNEDKGDGLAYHSLTPKHMFKLWTDYNLPGDYSKWTVGGGVTVKSKHANSGTYWLMTPDGWSQPDFKIEQGGYAIWDAHVEYAIDDQWALALNVNNVFDKTYYSTIGTPGGGNWYGEPRNATLTLRGLF